MTRWEDRRSCRSMAALLRDGGAFKRDSSVAFESAPLASRQDYAVMYVSSWPCLVEMAGALHLYAATRYFAKAPLWLAKERARSKAGRRRSVASARTERTRAVRAELRRMRFLLVHIPRRQRWWPRVATAVNEDLSERRSARHEAQLQVNRDVESHLVARRRRATRSGNVARQPKTTSDRRKSAAATRPMEARQEGEISTETGLQSNNLTAGSVGVWRRW